jgi:hypothetical protein
MSFIDITSITLVVVPLQPIPMPSLSHWDGPDDSPKRLAAPPVVHLLPATCPQRLRKQRPPTEAQERRRFLADFAARLATLAAPVEITYLGNGLLVYSRGRKAFEVHTRPASPPRLVLCAALANTFKAQTPDWSFEYRLWLGPKEFAALRAQYLPPEPPPTPPDDARTRFEADVRAEFAQHAGHKLTMIGKGAEVCVTDLVEHAGFLRARRTWTNSLELEEFVPTSQRDRGQQPRWRLLYPGAGQDPNYLWTFIDRLVEVHNAALAAAV